MPRIDPLQLLNCLNVLLTPSGGMKSEREVARISSLMEKFSKKLVSKCVYLLILKSSDPHLLCKFMGLGGWNLIYNWLVHSIEAKNYPFLTELLEVILICPVDIERLKSNPMPKQIKALSRDNTVDARVKDIASDIVKYWLNIVKGTPVPVNNVINQHTVIKQVPITNSHQEKALKPNNFDQSEDVHVRKSEDTSYAESTSPSDSSTEDVDENDVFITNRKSQLKIKKTVSKDKIARKSSQTEKPKLRSKLITSLNSKESKPGSIKLKIEKRSDHSPDSKTRKEEKVLEEKLKEKRRLKEEKEREKFAKFKQVREKKDKHKDRNEADNKNKDKAVHDEKVMDYLTNFISKPLEKLGRIPKITKEKANSGIVEKVKDEKKSLRKDDKLVKEIEKDIKKDTKKPVSTPPPKKPVSMSVEKRFPPGETKPKTVKAYNSKFRLTGLEQEAPKPPLRKTSNSATLASNISSSAEKSTVKRSPTKDSEEPAEKKARSPDGSFTEEKSPVTSRSKKPFLLESDSFMNAMDVAISEQRELRTKKKKATQKLDGDIRAEDGLLKKNPDTALPSTKLEKDPKPAFKFYKDTLESSSIDEPMDTFTPEDNLVSLAETSQSNENNIKVSDPMKPRSAEGLKSALSIFKTKSHPKKSVMWKADEELEAVQYFEVDATERTNVVRTFWDLQMIERNRERESLQMVRKTNGNDKMMVQTKWKTLVKIDLPTPTTARGSNSQEKAIQYARERSVPTTLYYNKNQIPDTPFEPDPENHPVSIPPTIPLDDISGSQDSINDFSAIKWPEPKLFSSENGDTNAIRGFVPGAAPPIFPPFPDGTFPPPFGQPFFSGGPMPPLPVPPQSNWNSGNNDQNLQQPAIPWTPSNVMPPPGMMGPPPFGMMGPFPPMPAGFPAPNMFPPPNITPPINNNNSNNPTSTSGSNNNSNTSSNSDSPSHYSKSYSSSSTNEGSKRWNSDDRYHNKKDSWKHSHERGGRERRGGWRGGGGGSSSKLCRNVKSKGYCSVSGCRFYHPENWES